jgi:hypothetical protein
VIIEGGLFGEGIEKSKLAFIVTLLSLLEINLAIRQLQY